MVADDPENWSPENTFRVLIASDVHLGYLEDDPVRGEDSFTAFEEILSLAVQYDVDFVLLGGDLFHHAKPSPNCMFKCTQLIRKYCLGDKPVSIEILSDQLENFSRNVNYEDPNLNVSYPILSIHGNHDDPVGEGSISSLDILSITGLVNYFGRCSDYTQVRIAPVLMQKGNTKLALYGLSHMKDKRLASLFYEKKVEMEVPDNSNDWFNLLVLHQNRADRGPNNYIREDVLPNFLDLVVWGHEHDSLVSIMKSKKGDDGFSVIQPGSTVATSLAAGEALQKHCVLLQLHESEYTVVPIPLKTVRPFIFKTIVLSEENFKEENVKENDKVQSFLKEKVNEAIDEANKLHSGDPKQPSLPLIRLSVFYEREGQDFNRIRFGQNYNGLVANPNDILIMKREKKVREKKEKQEEDDDIEMATAAAQATDIESLIQSYYEALPVDRRLTVLSVRAMTEGVKDFTLKHDDDIFKRIFDAHKKRCVDFLLESNAETEEEIKEKIHECKEALDSADTDQLKSMIDSAADAARRSANSGKTNASNNKKPSGVVVLSSEEEEQPAEPTPTTRGRSRGARATRSRGGTRSRGRVKASSPEPPPEPERRTPRRSAAQKTNSWIQNLIVKGGKGRNIPSSEDSD